MSEFADSLKDIHLVLVDEPIVQKAQAYICGCRACSKAAQIPFNYLLDRVTGNEPGTEYVLYEVAKCPRCGRDITEKTPVEFQPSASSLHRNEPVR